MAGIRLVLSRLGLTDQDGAWDYYDTRILFSTDQLSVEQIDDQVHVTIEGEVSHYYVHWDKWEEKYYLVSNPPP